jgi:hypothetical protein
MTYLRSVPLDVIALLLLIVAISWPWPSGLHDFRGWTVRLVLTTSSILGIVFQLVKNGAFRTPSRYVRLAADAVLLVVALLWQVNLLLGLQGMS